MNRHLFYILSLFSLLFFSGCKDDDDDVIPVLELEAERANFGGEAGSFSIEVKSLPQELTVGVDAEGKDWCSVHTDGNRLVIDVISNPDKKVRQTYVNVSNGKLKSRVLTRQLGTDADILLSRSGFIVDPNGGDITLDVTTNVEEMDIITSDWIVKKMSTRAGDKFTTSYVFNIRMNKKDDGRGGEIIFKDMNSNIQEIVTVTQKGLGTYESSDLAGIEDDVEVEVDHAMASSENAPSESIDKSCDNDMSTIFHSQYGVPGKCPVTLTYYLKNADEVDYLIYYPRSDGGVNGIFGEVEIQVSTEETPNFTTVMTKDFGFSTSPTLVTFPAAVMKPKAVQFIVKTGANNSHASCAEMKFYAKNPNSFDPLTLFTDETCSELKSGVTEEDINACEYPFFKNIAFYMYNDKYPGFRIADYKAYQHPDVMAKENKTSKYSLLDNPTGISVKKDEVLVVMVGDTHGQNVSLRVQNLDVPGGDGFNNNQSYALRRGVNKLTMNDKGLVYVMYHTDDYATAEPIRIHLASGTVNGYFDVAKHNREDWSKLINAATDTYFDVVGQYAHLTFPVNSLLKTSNGKDLIDIYDKIVYEEQVFMGLKKYNRMFNNRMYLHVMYHQYMYSTDYHTAYNVTTLDNLCDVENMKTNNWGPAHEIGHSNQTRPGLKWFGLVEVTNNIHSLYIQRLFGAGSRLQSTAPSNAYNNYYEKAMSIVFTDNSYSHARLSDVFYKLVPFWQLELYMEYVLGKTDFYKDVYEKIRITQDKATAGESQIEFAYICSEVSGLDLTDFFVKWGFLVPVDYTFSDTYTENTVKVTDNQIIALKRRITTLGLPKPRHSLEYICDNTVDTYKANASVTKGTASKNGQKFVMSNWKNVVAYEVYEGSKLVFVSTESSFTVDTDLSTNFKVYAIAANGTKTQVTF